MKIRLAAVLGAALLVAAVAPPAPASLQEDDGIFIDEIDKKFLDKVGKAIEAKDWKAAFDCYDLALVKHRGKLIRPDPNVPRWCSVIEHLNRIFAKLPSEAFDYYRREHDGKANDAYERAGREKDPRERDRRMEEIVNRFFFARITAEILDGLGARALEDHRPQDAVHFWRKMLEQYPDCDVPRPVIAARIAMAAKTWGNESALNALKEYVRQEKIDGPVSVGDEPTTLVKFLESVSIPAAAPSRSVSREPSVPEGAGLFERKSVCVRNEVKRWTYDLVDPQAPPRGPVIRRPRMEQVARPEFPFLPVHARVDNKDIVLLSNGQQLFAIEPSLATSDRPRGCIRWRFPEAPVARFDMGELAAYFSYLTPFIGAAVSGDMAIATLYSEAKIPEGRVGGSQDLFQGTCRLAALDLRNGRLIWDTDDAVLHARYRKLDFYDRNWSFSGPPLVKGDRLYVGICSSPAGESESRLLCISRRTGEPIWSTLLGWAGGPNRMGFPGSRGVTLLTTLVEDGGVIYAMTNVGIVAAVHSVSGSVLWLSKYPRSARIDPGRGDSAQDGRPANPPFIHRGRLYVLPQDQQEWQWFDIATGERLTPPPLRKSDGAEIRWTTLYQMLGVVDDWMVLGGTESFFVNLVDRRDSQGKVTTPAGRAFVLTSSNVSRSGRGVIAGETIYLPTWDEQNGALSIYHGKGAWRFLEPTKWKEPGEYGNLLVAGDYLVVAAQTKFMVFTDEATIDREFAVRLAQSPPNPGAFLQHGDIMMKSERLKKASESYLAFVRAAEGDPKLERKVLEKKTELYDIFMRRGLEASGKDQLKDRLEAIEHFSSAQTFAYDESTLGESTRRLAEAYEKLALARNDKDIAKKAVEEYQKILENSRDGLHKPEGSEVIVKMWTYAQERVRELRRTFGDEVYAPVERAAKEALDRVKEGSTDALKRVAEIYPETRAAVEAYRRMLEEFTRQERWEKVLSTLREIKERYPQEFKAEFQKRVNEALEKLLDWKRLSVELRLMAEQFGDERIEIDGREVLARDYAAERLREIEGRGGDAAPPLPDPPRPVFEFGKPLGPASHLELTAGRVLLEPNGPVPPSLSGDHEFFAFGSAIELWNVREKRKLWSAPHPGGWLGVSWRDVRGGTEPGVTVTEVVGDSPAEKAGLNPGDVVVALSSRTVRAETFDGMLAEAGAGAKVRLTLSRAGRREEVDVTLTAWPERMKPGIIGAAFTREYRIAVVWPDMVATFDVSTGLPGWTFRTVRDRFVLDKVGAVDGRLLLHEHAYAGRLRSPLRSLSQEMQRQMLTEAEAHARLICLDDVTGEVRWARPLPFDANAAPEHFVEIYGDYFGGAFAVFSRTSQTNVVFSELLLLGADGGVLRNRISFGTGVLTFAADAEGGVFYAVEGSGARVLRGVRMWGPNSEKGGNVFDATLQPMHMDPNSTICDIEVRGEWLALIAPGIVVQPGQPQPANSGGGKITIFSCRTGKEHAVVTLPAGRALPVRRVPLAAVGPDGALYVYNVPESAQNPPAAERRAYLTAWQLADAERKSELLWDAVAPWLAPDVAAEILPADGLVLLQSPKGSPPQGGADQPIGAIYSRAEGGYLKSVINDLSAGPLGRPFIVRRGRVYVQTARGLIVYGN